MGLSLATDSCHCKQLIRVWPAARLQLMVEDVKQAFSRRLNVACDEAGEPVRGRRAMLARLVKVSGEAARKWLSGEAIPAMDHLAVISAHLGVQAQWLLSGVGRKYIDQEADALTEEEREHLRRLRCLPQSERARAFRVVDALVSPSHTDGHAA